MTDEELDSFLEVERTCRMASQSSDGRLHNTPLWFVWLDGALWVSSVVRTRRWSDLRERPAVSVVVDAGTDYDDLRGAELIGEVEVVGEVPRHGASHPGLEAIETAYAAKYSTTGEFEHDGRHAWLRLAPATIVSWDFRKLHAS